MLRPCKAVAHGAAPFQTVLFGVMRKAMKEQATAARPWTPIRIPLRIAVNNFEDDIHLAVRSAAPVLLTGGAHATQALAYRIHSSSGWRYGPFVTVDCTSDHDESLEASLFEAVFPPDVASDTGGPTLQLAQPGTVLVKEVGRLSRPLQEKFADRLGEITAFRVPGRSCRRVIATTSEPLLPRVEDGTFDDRLYYRLNVIHLMAVIRPL
jgi:DNA-binding NtrC family response regulator